MTSNLLELAARCEKATGLDREMEIAIAVALEVGGKADVPINTPSFTASIDAALTLVPSGWHLGILTECNENDGVHACLTENDEPCRDAVGDAATLPLALVAAALRARASQGAES
jgi:hypothetical protein